MTHPDVTPFFSNKMSTISVFFLGYFVSLGVSVWFYKLIPFYNLEDEIVSFEVLAIFLAIIFFCLDHKRRRRGVFAWGCFGGIFSFLIPFILVTYGYAINMLPYAALWSITIYFCLKILDKIRDFFSEKCGAK